MTAAPQILGRRYTVPEYLDIVETLDGRFELVDGKLVDLRAMAGAAEPHALITANLIVALSNALRDKPCRTYSSDLILRIPRKAKCRLADVSVICGPTVFDPEDASRSKAVMNPAVIVEVLSDTSEADDRGEKFDDYREIDSLREYVLVSQDMAMIQTFRRRDDGTWLFSAFAGLQAAMRLESLNVSIKAADIYRNVQFQASSQSPPV